MRRNDNRATEGARAPDAVNLGPSLRPQAQDPAVLPDAGQHGQKWHDPVVPR